MTQKEIGSLSVVELKLKKKNVNECEWNDGTLIKHCMTEGIIEASGYVETIQWTKYHTYTSHCSNKMLQLCFELFYAVQNVFAILYIFNTFFPRSFGTLFTLQRIAWKQTATSNYRVAVNSSQAVNFNIYWQRCSSGKNTTSLMILNRC